MTNVIPFKKVKEFNRQAAKINLDYLKASVQAMNAQALGAEKEVSNANSFTKEKDFSHNRS